MTKYPELFAALCEPFGPDEVKTRQAPGGRSLSYITARTAMNRLDEVLGPEMWWDEYVPLENSVICKLTVRLPDLVIDGEVIPGPVITKSDAGGYAGMADQGDDDKSGFSDAFKRVCAKFGVGRHLYRDGIPNFGQASAAHQEPERHPEPARSNLPQARRPDPQPQRDNGRRDDNPQGGDSPLLKTPRSGRALFPWIKDGEQFHEASILKHINEWAKMNDLPGRLVDFDEDQTAMAVAEVRRKMNINLHTGGDHAPDAPRNNNQGARECGELASRVQDILWRHASDANGGTADFSHFVRSFIELNRNMDAAHQIEDLADERDLHKLRYALGAANQMLQESGI